MGTPRGFHDQHIGATRLARFGGQAPPQFEIPRIEQRLPVRLDESHGAAKNMSRRKQGQAVGIWRSTELSVHSELQDMFSSLAANSCLHEPGRGGGENYLPVRAQVIRVGMADENLFGSSLRLVRIQPQSKRWKKDATAAKLNAQIRHEATLVSGVTKSIGRPPQSSNSRSRAPKPIEAVSLHDLVVLNLVEVVVTHDRVAHGSPDRWRSRARRLGPCRALRR